MKNKKKVHPAVKYKKCRVCKKSKFESEFYSDKKYNLLQTICKSCSIKKVKEWYKKIATNPKLKEKLYKRHNQWRKENSEIVNGYNRKYSRKVRLDIFSFYGGNPPKCACCGEMTYQFLSIDHIKGGGHKHREELKKLGYTLYQWLKKNNYPIGYQVLCFNCNQAKGLFGKCPHKKKYENKKK